MAFSDDVRSRLDADAAQIIGKYPGPRSALLPLLHLVQAEEGYVSADGIAYCAGQLGLTETDSSGTAVFVNLPVLPTQLHLTATVPALGRTMADTMVFAREGGESEVYVVPNQ